MIVVDVETTGEVPHIHSILSIGAVDFANPSNTFYKECKIRDGAAVDPIALKINGFSKEEITRADKESLEEIMKAFLKWCSAIDDITLAGYNHHMDAGFIDHSLQTYNLANPFKFRLVDGHALAFTNYMSRGISPPLSHRGSNLKANTALNYCGLPTEPQPHNALTGAKMEAEMLSRLIYGKNLMDEFKQFPIPDYLKK